MANADPKPLEALPPHAQFIQMGLSFWISRAVYAAAKLGLADKLAGGPRSAADLAKETGTLAPALHRLMRLLAGLGILKTVKTEPDGQRFALTPLGESMKSGAPGAAHATLLSLAGPIFWQAFGEYMYSLETGKTAFEKAYGMPVFDYLAKHPETGGTLAATLATSISETSNHTPDASMMRSSSSTKVLIRASASRPESSPMMKRRRPLFVFASTRRYIQPSSSGCAEIVPTRSGRKVWSEVSAVLHIDLFLRSYDLLWRSH